MLPSLTILVVCQLIGEALTRVADLPIPGPVLGLICLLALFMVRGGPTDAMRDTAGALLRNLSLLFVPAGVGIVTQLDVLGENLWPAACAILVSTALGFAAAALVMRRLTGPES